MEGEDRYWEACMQKVLKRYKSRWVHGYRVERLETDITELIAILLEGSSTQAMVIEI